MLLPTKNEAHSAPIRLMTETSRAVVVGRNHAASISHHRDHLLSMTQSAATWRAPLLPVSKTG